MAPPTEVSSPRPYRMRARAEGASRTRARVITAVIELANEKPVAAITLPLIADRAGVAVQTVLRQFGSRERLIDEAAGTARAEVLAERSADPHDVDGSLDALVAHYEARGDGVLLLLGQESWDQTAATITADGKSLHRDWVRRAFAHALSPLTEAEQDEALDLLVVATDVYAWKLLRRDRGLSRDDTAERMRRLAASVLSLYAPSEE
ncbi:transcriptional regulator, TetR family [Microbacterium sp. cf046]|uniref:TetR/AcrR family transcriptional regulator n=1 Tax=Microbacterium sp. cf046 TaxID=1761803 RepID=UPI0008EAE2A0|nr:TetR/AcrR family transcriptional regulator [Microbacterium sp. cf046]SFR93262.1 transcriptional regulator, TetR family [Microbacterium sp. cf046]